MAWSSYTPRTYKHEATGICVSLQSLIYRTVKPRRLWTRKLTYITYKLDLCTCIYRIMLSGKNGSSCTAFTSFCTCLKRSCITACHSSVLRLRPHRSFPFFFLPFQSCYRVPSVYQRGHDLVSANTHPLDIRPSWPAALVFLFHINCAVRTPPFSHLKSIRPWEFFCFCLGFRD